MCQLNSVAPFTAPSSLAELRFALPYWDTSQFVKTSFWPSKSPQPSWSLVPHNCSQTSGLESSSTAVVAFWGLRSEPEANNNKIHQLSKSYSDKKILHMFHVLKQLLLIPSSRWRMLLLGLASPCWGFFSLPIGQLNIKGTITPHVPNHAVLKHDQQMMYLAWPQWQTYIMSGDARNQQFWGFITQHDCWKTYYWSGSHRKS